VLDVEPPAAVALNNDLAAARREVGLWVWAKVRSRVQSNAVSGAARARGPQQ